MAESLDDILRDTTFDSRQIIDRINELQNDNTNDDGDLVFEDEDDDTEFGLLSEIENEGSGYAPDWNYGVTFIRDDAFEDYARDYAEEIGAVDINTNWPMNNIDWEAAALELRQDYTSIEIQGEDWWYR